MWRSWLFWQKKIGGKFGLKMALNGLKLPKMALNCLKLRSQPKIWRKIQKIGGDTVTAVTTFFHVCENPE